jgi:uncharacterized protein (DUF885 family)
MGLYDNPYSLLSKWEWDLVRSTRLIIDYGIHFHGWTKEKALEFWKQTIPNQDEIANREVERIIKMPGQVISYRVGEAKILELRQRMKNKLGNQFNLRKFHNLVISHGDIPLSVLEKMVDRDI